MWHAHNMEADVMAVGDPDFTAAEEECGDAASLIDGNLGIYMEVLIRCELYSQCYSPQSGYCPDI